MAVALPRNVLARALRHRLSAERILVYICRPVPHQSAHLSTEFSMTRRSRSPRSLRAENAARRAQSLFAEFQFRQEPHPPRYPNRHNRHEAPDKLLRVFCFSAGFVRCIAGRGLQVPADLRDKTVLRLRASEAFCAPRIKWASKLCLLLSALCLWLDRKKP